MFLQCAFFGQKVFKEERFFKVLRRVNNMVRTSIDRNKLIFASFKNIKILLEDLKTHPHISFQELMKIGRLRGGTYTNAIKDSKIMGFVVNGNGLWLTEKGEKILLDFSLENIKREALQVELFQKLYSTYPNMTSKREIRSFFLENAKGISKTRIGQATQRYIENILNNPASPDILLKREQSEINKYLMIKQNLQEYKSIQDIESYFKKLKEKYSTTELIELLKQA